MREVREAFGMLTGKDIVLCIACVVLGYVFLVGCQEHAWEDWRREYESIAERNGIKSGLLKEYIRIFNFFVKEYGDGFTIDE